MTAMKPVLDLVIDANVVLVLAFCLWWIAHATVLKSRMKTDYVLQLRLLQAVLIFVLVSPLFSYLLVAASQHLWPHVPMTVSDLAVAAYLRGEIAMPALQFEALLNSRSSTLDAFFAGDLPWLTALAVVLLAGAGMLLARTFATLLRIHRIISSSYVWRRTARTDIHLSDTISVPFATRGILRRHVVIPSALLTSPSELKVVLAHEFEHLRQGDVEWELAFELLRPVLYFNPAFHLWKRRFSQIREFNCDQSVLLRLGITPAQYANCLLKFCSKDRSKQQAPTAFNVAFLSAGSTRRAALEQRLLALAEPRAAASGGMFMLCLSAFLAVGVILAASSVRNPGDWTQDRLTLSTVVNLERLEMINRR